MIMNYKQQLKHPNWQKKRLEILNRDNFTCQACGSGNKTLNIHHLYYADNCNVWDYENEALLTLCEDCHKREEREMKQEIVNLIESVKMSCIPSYYLRCLISAIRSFQNKPEELKVFITHFQKKALRDNNVINMSLFLENAKLLSNGL